MANSPRNGRKPGKQPRNSESRQNQPRNSKRSSNRAPFTNQRPIPPSTPAFKREKWRSKGYIAVLRDDRGKIRSWQKWNPKVPLRSLKIPVYVTTFKNVTRRVTVDVPGGDVVQLEAKWFFKWGNQRDTVRGYSYLMNADIPRNKERMINQSLANAFSKSKFSMGKSDYNFRDAVDEGLEYIMDPTSLRYIYWYKNPKEAAKAKMLNRYR